MDQPTTASMLEALDRFVGEWTMTAGPPGGPMWPGEGRIRFDWIEGRAFLAERWRLDIPEPPEGVPTSGTSLYGCDAAHGTYYKLYYDNREVYRVYELGLHDRVWTQSRKSPPFAQRFTGTFSEDGRRITGRWELAEDGQDWATDFDVIYTRVP